VILLEVGKEVEKNEQGITQYLLFVALRVVSLFANNYPIRTD
jgi:hypothetical protein